MNFDFDEWPKQVLGLLAAIVFGFLLCLIIRRCA